MCMIDGWMEISVAKSLNNLTPLVFDIENLEPQADN